MHQRFVCCLKFFPLSEEGLSYDLCLPLYGINSNILTPEMPIFSSAKPFRCYFIVLKKVLKHTALGR